MDDEQVCRICRSGDEAGPLYHPCRCSGHIKLVHADCLGEWLAVSKGNKCEICRYSFRWEKVYADQAPSRLPVLLIVRHLCLTALSGTRWALRFVLAAFVWIGVLPYLVLWATRWLFYIARNYGAAWASAVDVMGLSSAFMLGRNQSLINAQASSKAWSVLEDGNTASLASTSSPTLEAGLAPLSTASAVLVESVQAVTEVLNETVLDIKNLTSTASPSFWQAFSSIFSGSQDIKSAAEEAAVSRSNGTMWQYANRQYYIHQETISSVARDCFSGQLIVCSVVIVFITAFLLREWVIANQPLPAAAEPPAEAAPAPAAGPEAPLDLPQPRDFVDGLELGRLNVRMQDMLEEERELRQENSLLQQDVERLQRLHQSRLQERGSSSAAHDGESASQAFGSYQLGEDGLPILPPSSGGERIRIDSQGSEQTGIYSRLPSERDAEASSNPAARAFLARQREREQLMAYPGDRFNLLDPSTPTSSSRPESAAGQYFEDSHDLAPSTLGRAVTPPLPLELPPPLVLPEPILHDEASEHSSDDWEDEEEDHDSEDDFTVGAGQGADGAAGRGGGEDLAAEDIAAIEAARNEDDVFFEADLEGIMEAIGLQGPLLGLLQNSALMVLLIFTFIFITTFVPLVFGKTVVVLNAQRLVLLPINLVRFVTDPVADALIYALGGGAAKKSDSSVSNDNPSHTSVVMGIVKKLASFRSALSRKKAAPPPSRISLLLVSLRQHREVYREALTTYGREATVAIKSRWATMALEDSPADRLACIVVGYLFFSLVAAIYLRYTRNIQARNATIAVRDALKQQFLLIKAAIFFVVEIVLFPTICGVLLNLATIPLFPGVTIGSRIAYHVESPISSGFLTWLAGTNFMYSFVETISIIRKCIRKGVLWFIRDPADPDTNPLREILETPVFNQAKKITRSLLVYGSIVLTCFGVFPWLCRYMNIGIFPLRFDMTRPISSVPFDLLFILFVVPFTLGRTRPRRLVKKLLSEWVIFTARQLRLSSYMLGVRHPDEEGTHVRKTWQAWLLLRKAPIPSDGETCVTQASGDDVFFRKDGGFARVVAADNVKIVTSRMFVQVNEDGTAQDAEGEAAIKEQLSKPGNDESKFTVVYTPPHFNMRALLFVYLLWITSSFALFSMLTIPLVAGRLVLDSILAKPVHDTYSLLVGLHIGLAGSALYNLLAKRYRQQLRHRRRSRPDISATKSAAEQVATLLHLALLFLNAGIVLPVLLGAGMQILVLPFVEAKESVPTVSLTNVWAYGLLVMSVACSVCRWDWRVNSLASLLATVKIDGIVKASPTLNARLLRFEWEILTMISIPGAATALFLLFTKALTPGNARIAQRVAASRAIIYRAFLLPTSLTLLIRCLARPMQSLANKWLASVWESEFVIQRKLKNIDDPPEADMVSAEGIEVPQP